MNEKQQQKMSTCNWWDFKSLGSWPTLYAQKLPGHGLGRLKRWISVRDRKCGTLGLAFAAGDTGGRQVASWCGKDSGYFKCFGGTKPATWKCWELSLNQDPHAQGSCCLGISLAKFHLHVTSMTCGHVGYNNNNSLWLVWSIRGET